MAIESLLKTDDLKLVDSVEVHGSSYQLGDILVSFGQIAKNNAITKEIILRVEHRSLINTTSFEVSQYESMASDMFAMMGMAMKAAFYNEDQLAKTQQFIRKKYRDDETAAKQSELVFDQNIVALMHCLLFFGLS